MATLDFQLELGFPRKNFKDILAATLPPISVRATKLFEKKLKATLGYQLGFPQRCNGKVLMATLDYKLGLGFSQRIQKHLVGNSRVF